jgi:hypothetical protein
VSGTFVVDHSFIPDRPPWPEKWPEPSTPEEAVQFRAFRLHLDRLRALHEKLAPKPAMGIPTRWSPKTNLGGYLVFKDYEKELDTRAARLDATRDGFQLALRGLPALPASALRLVPEIAWPQVVLRTLPEGPEKEEQRGLLSPSDPPQPPQSATPDPAVAG